MGKVNNHVGEPREDGGLQVFLAQGIVTEDEVLYLDPLYFVLGMTTSEMCCSEVEHLYFNA